MGDSKGLDDPSSFLRVVLGEKGIVGGQGGLGTGRGVREEERPRLDSLSESKDDQE